jgi:hypothetical protein
MFLDCFHRNYGNSFLQLVNVRCWRDGGTMEKEGGMVRVTQKKMLKTLVYFLAIVCCTANVMALGFDSAGARQAIDTFKTKMGAMDLASAQAKLQSFNTGLSQVQSSTYYSSSQPLRDAYAAAAVIYKTQNEAFTALVASVPKLTDADALETNYAARLKALNDEVASLSQALTSAQNDASKAVQDATTRVQDALKALDSAKAFFSTVSGTAASTSTAPK